MSITLPCHGREKVASTFGSATYMAKKNEKTSENEKIKRKDGVIRWLNSDSGKKYYENILNIKNNKILEYNKFPKLCLYCNSSISYEKRNNKFCGYSCCAFFNNSNRGPMSDEQKQKMHKTFQITRPKTPNIISYCEICNKQLETRYGQLIKRFCSQKCACKTPGRKKAGGGYRKNSSRGIKGWYKGYWCDSSWELAYVIYNLDHNILFYRNTKSFDYMFNGNKHKYYPDFILEDGSYVEIKNFKSELTDAKIKNFPYIINVLYKNDLCFVFKYVYEKYGKDFIRLYNIEKEKYEAISY